MRRRLAYLLVWAVVTGSTIGVSYWGIRSVLVAATPDSSTPLSAADLRRAAPSPSPSPAPPPSPSPTSPSPVSPSPTTAPPPPPQTASAVPPVPGPSPTPGWQRSPDGPGGTAFTRLFRVQGGEVTFFCARGDVHVVTIAPRQGFTPLENRLSADSLRVSFFTERHISRVWVTWRNGCYAEITESV